MPERKQEKNNPRCSLGCKESQSQETVLSFPLSDIMDLRHQSSAMCIIMLGGEDTHQWSATNVGNPILATIPVTSNKNTNQQNTHTSHYPSRQVEIFKAAMIEVFFKKINYT